MAPSNPFAAAELSDVQVQLDATGAQVNGKPGNAGSDARRGSAGKPDDTAGGLNPMEIETEETSGSCALTVLGERSCETNVHAHAGSSSHEWAQAAAEEWYMCTDGGHGHVSVLTTDPI